MKSILRVVIRYIVSAAFICIFVLFFNFCILIYCKVTYDAVGLDGKLPLDNITNEFYKEDEKVMLSNQGIKKLDDNFIFGMLVADSGEILYKHNLPSELDRTYTLQDISSASKWYLDGYPVYMWNNKYGVLVVGRPKNSVWKYNIEYSLPGLNAALVAIPIANLLLLFILCLFFGWRFFMALKPIAQGIESLSQQRKVKIPEKGILVDLSKRINKTSEILVKQKELLEKRDDARTQWIAGVSHDIRTPLSMIMGYADNLEQAEFLTEDYKKEAGIIKKQSLLIKDLIEDLNLTSKLEYQMQPLRLENYCIAKLLRKMVADFYNKQLLNQYSVNLEVESDAEKFTMELDYNLFTRAVINLIGNSIRHNPSGCIIDIQVQMDHDHCHINYSDNGIGISDGVLKAFHEERQETDGPHINGLYLVKRIIKAHGGIFELKDCCEKGMEGTIIF